MSNNKKKMDHALADRLTLALGIALLPPIWAVLSGHVGIKTGAVALICAAVFVTNGNKYGDAVKIAVGFLLGDLWAVIVVWFSSTVNWNPDLETFCALFLLGGLAVLIGTGFPKYIFLPAWLCGWAVGLTIMGPMHISKIGTLPIQIGAAMLAGVFYVGICVDMFQHFLLRKMGQE